MKRFSLFLILGMVPILISLSRAAVPQLLNFQGLLTDPMGVPLVSDTNSVDFNIYDAAVAGNSKWSETQSVITDGQGRFSVLLGSVNPIEDTVFIQPDRWLGVKVGADPELSPRTQIVSVGYSNRVSTVDGSTGGIITGDVTLQSTLTADVLEAGTASTPGLIEAQNGNGTDGVSIVGSGSGGELSIYDESSNVTHFLTPGFFGDGGSAVFYGDQTFTTGIELDGDGSGTDNPMLYMVGAGSGQTAVIDLSSTGNGSVSLPVSAISSAEVLDEPGVAGISASYLPAGAAIQTITARTITCPAAGYVLAVASCEWDVGITGGHVVGTLDWMFVGLSTSPATIPADQDFDLTFSAALPSSASGYIEQSASVEIFPVAAGPVTIYYNCDPVAGELGGFFEVNLELLYVPTFYGTVSAMASAGGETFKSDQPNQITTGATSAAVDLEKERAESIAANDARIEKELADVKAELEAIKKQLKPGQLTGKPQQDQ